MKKAFTLVELIVVITILAVLATIGFISMSWYTQSARNWVVLTDLKTLKKAFELHLIEWKSLPDPDGPTHNITQAGGNLFTQWYIWKNVTSEIKKVPQTPVLPISGDYYSYSKTQYGNNYQIMWTLNEANTGIIPNSFAEGENTKVIDGNYNGLVAYTFTGGVQYLVALPSLMTSSGSDMIYGDTKNFLYENDSNQTIDYTPASIWRWVDLPDSIQDRNAMMDNILRAYEESSVSLSTRFKDIAQWPDSIAYNKMWQIILRDYIQDDSIDISKISRQCDVWGWDVRQDLQWSTWWECYRVSCYAGFNPVWETDCVWSGSLELTADSFNKSQEPLLSVKNINWKNYFYSEWQKWYYLSAYIPIDTNKTYNISWDFENLWTPTNVMYFGITSYDENKVEINARRNLRRWEAATISSFDNEKIITQNNIVGWVNNTDSFHNQSIWVYYDWDMTHLPDEVLRWQNYHYSNEERTAAYSHFSGNQIYLNRKIPDNIAENIIPGVTKIINHYSGPTFIYANNDSTLSGSTTHSLSWINQEAFGSLDKADPTFRANTKYVRISILTNHIWNSWTDYKMWFDNIKFEELP